MNTYLRLIRFVGFTLAEYIRSGRALAELIATLVAYYLLFRRSATSMTPEMFFSLAGLITLALAFYSTSTVMSLSDRPQGYLVLSRRVGRGGYLIGHYLAALVIVVACYGMLSLLTLVFSPIGSLGMAGWFLGSVPLLLNIALVTAAVTLLSPLVLSAGWRLAALGGVAVAFSNSLINSQTLRDLSPTLRNLLASIQVAFSTPLLPAFTGFALAVSRDYSGANIVIPVAQLSLALGLLMLALYAFTRREIIFHG